MQTHTHEAFKIIISLKIKLLQFSLQITRMRSRMCFKKIEHVCGSVSLDDQGHSPRPRGEDLLRQLYTCDRLQYRIQHLEAWTFIDSRHRYHRKEEKENLHTKSHKSKARATTLSKTDLS
jgi:hypothetical protein